MKSKPTPLEKNSYFAAGVARARYATREDFCGIFDQEMNSLYSLSLLLTGSHEIAQQCFLAALEDCRTGMSVFKEWARSWTRRAVIKNAINLVGPSPDDVVSAAAEGPANDMHDTARSLLQLGPFDRFVFVMSVLERYGIRECAALLNCRAIEVEQARQRVLQFIAADGRDLAPAVLALTALQSPDSAKSLRTPITM